MSKQRKRHIAMGVASIVTGMSILGGWAGFGVSLAFIGAVVLISALSMRY